MRKCSTIGPSARAGKKVNAPTIRITPISRAANSHPVVGNVPALGGTDPVSFKTAGDQCSGQALAPTGKCGIGVEFAPPGNASGTQSATLTISFTYGANQGNVSASLSGKVK